MTSPPTPRLQPPTIPILLVDDDPTIQTVFSRLLGMNGYTVECARTAQDAIAQARRRDFAAAVVDLTLGNGSGLDVVAWFRSQHHYGAMPILILTGLPVLERHEEERIRRLGAPVFHKPQSVRALIEHLDRFVKAGR